MNLEKLRSIQKKLSKHVIIQDEFIQPLAHVAGIDLAFKSQLAITACVTTSISPFRIFNQKTILNKITFPYIPTLLCFREGPPIIETIKSLKVRPHIFLINAHGLAHPLLCGCASYVGVLTGEVTIGVAANNLCGKYGYVPLEVGETVAMYLRKRQVGWVLKSKKRCKPIFISPGHKIGLDSCLKIVRKLVIGHKLPEPLQLAHRLANYEKSLLI